jgi:hypothetical protein
MKGHAMPGLRVSLGTLHPIQFARHKGISAQGVLDEWTFQID